MSLLSSVFKELIGMFIDDGALALLSILLIAIITAAVEFAGLPALTAGLLLLAGCILILAESTWRAARGKRRGLKDR